MSDWLRQPLLHYLVLGAGVLVVQSVRPPADQVVVTTERQAALQADLETGLGRPPTDDERQAATLRWVDQELAVREAHSLGLHLGDPVVRRRLIQKVEFLDRNKGLGSPTDADLERVLAQNPERFLTPATVSLEQELLRQGQPVAAPLPRSLTARPLPGIAALFGPEFAREIQAAPLDTWVEVPSAFGTHRVRVLARTDAQPGELQAHRPQLEALWLEGARDEQVQARAQERRDRARVVVQ